ncbi:MAG: hypothetical protein V4612_03185 [Pseudomonadota bacterium]
MTRSSSAKKRLVSKLPQVGVKRGEKQFDSCFSNIDDLMLFLLYPRLKDESESEYVRRQIACFLSRIVSPKDGKFFPHQKDEKLKEAIERLKDVDDLSLQEAMEVLQVFLSCAKRNGKLTGVADIDGRNLAHCLTVIDLIETELDKGTLPAQFYYPNRILSDFTKLDQKHERLLTVVTFFENYVFPNPKEAKNQFIIIAGQFDYRKKRSITDLIDLLMEVYQSPIGNTHPFASNENLDRVANLAINLLLMICELRELRKEIADRPEQFVLTQEQEKQIANLFGVVLCSRSQNSLYPKMANAMYVMGKLLFPDALERIIKNNPHLAHFNIEILKELNGCQHPFALTGIGTDYPFSLESGLDFENYPDSFIEEIIAEKDRLLADKSKLQIALEKIAIYEGRFSEIDQATLEEILDSIPQVSSPDEEKAELFANFTSARREFLCHFLDHEELFQLAQGQDKNLVAGIKKRCAEINKIKRNDKIQESGDGLYDRQLRLQICCQKICHDLIYQHVYHGAFCDMLESAKDSKNTQRQKQNLGMLLFYITQMYHEYYHVKENGERSAQYVKNIKDNLENKAALQNLFKLCFASFPQEMASVMDSVVLAGQATAENPTAFVDNQNFFISLFSMILEPAIKSCPADVQARFIDGLITYHKSSPPIPKTFPFSYQDFEKVIKGQFYLQSSILRTTAANFLEATLKRPEDKESRTALVVLASQEYGGQLIVDFIHSTFESPKDEELLTALVSIVEEEGLDSSFIKTKEAKIVAPAVELTSEEQIAILQDRIRELEEDIRTRFANEVRADVAPLDPLYLALEARISQLESELDKTKRSLAALEKTHNKTLDAHAELDKEHTKLVTGLKQEIQSLNSGNANLRKKLAASDNKGQTLGGELRSITQSLEEIKRSSRELKQKLTEAKAEPRPPHSLEPSSKDEEIKRLESELKTLSDQQVVLEEQKLSADNKNIQLYNRLCGATGYAELLRKPFLEPLDDQSLYDRVGYTTQAVVHSFDAVSNPLFVDVKPNAKIYYGSKVYYYILGSVYRGLQDNPDNKDFDIKIAVGDVGKALDKIKANAQQNGYSIAKNPEQFTDERGKKGFNIKLKHSQSPGPIDITILEGDTIDVGGGFQFYGQRPFIDATTKTLFVFGSSNHPQIDALVFLRHVQQDLDFVYTPNFETNKLFEALFLKDNFSGLPPHIFSETKFHQRIAEEFEQGYDAQVRQAQNFDRFVIDHFTNLKPEGIIKDHRYEQLRGLFFALKDKQALAEKAKTTTEPEQKMLEAREQMEQKLSEERARMEKIISEEKEKMRQEMEQEKSAEIAKIREQSRAELKKRQALEKELDDLKNTRSSPPPSVQEKPWQAGRGLPQSVINPKSATQQSPTIPNPDIKPKSSPSLKREMTILKRGNNLGASSGEKPR